MAIVFEVETGEVVTDANAYVSVEDFRQFFENRGVAAVAVDSGPFTEPKIQIGIIKATDYVDKRFGPRFKGYRKQSSQSLQWPRFDVVYSSGFLQPSDQIPVFLKRAVFEYAYLAMRLIDLLPVPAPYFNTIDTVTGEVVKNAGGPVYRTREVVGPIEDEVWYSDPTKLELQGRAEGVSSTLVSSINLPEYPVADEWLKELVTVGMTVQLERA